MDRQGQGEGREQPGHRQSPGISVRRVQQLYGEYRRSGNVPAIGKAGRPREETSDDERRAILDAFDRWKACACYLEE
ncbi:MAG: hypothetical protein JRN43_07350, partial [Nitrososphaerota archaeon]|nr:hypothetical protein [Nitrososphaerota archaeon]